MFAQLPAGPTREQAIWRRKEDLPNAIALNFLAPLSHVQLALRCH
jgi:hypothetical protein